LHLRRADTLLDFGCGTGRFSEFLPLGVTYHGLDWSAAMRERAAFDHPQAIVMDHLPKSAFDHTVVIGAFNLADNWTKTKTWAQLKELWNEATRRSLIVSVYRGRDPNCIHYQPKDLADFAERMDCTTFAIDGTFLKNDLLLALHR
jgi:SAM-dependent methyltransferase